MSEVSGTVDRVIVAGEGVAAVQVKTKSALSVPEVAV